MIRKFNDRSDFHPPFERRKLYNEMNNAGIADFCIQLKFELSYKNLTVFVVCHSLQIPALFIHSFTLRILGEHSLKIIFI